MSYQRFVGLSKNDVDTINSVLQRQAARNLRLNRLGDDESFDAHDQRVELRMAADEDLDMLVPILTLMLTGDRP